MASLEEKSDEGGECNNSEDDNIFVDDKDNKEATMTSLHHALAKLAEERQRHERTTINHFYPYYAKSTYKRATGKVSCHLSCSIRLMISVTLWSRQYAA